jgi:hypothetical protein
VFSEREGKGEVDSNTYHQYPGLSFEKSSRNDHGYDLVGAPPGFQASTYFPSLSCSFHFLILVIFVFVFTQKGKSSTMLGFAC